MQRFRIALATRCLNLPLRQSLKVAADCGAEGVQFDLRQELRPEELQDSGRRDLRHLLDELGLRVAGTTFTLRRELIDEHELDRRIAALKQAMSWTFQLQATVFTLRVGTLPEDHEGKPFVMLREILSDLAGYANHVGVVLAIQPAQRITPEWIEFLSKIMTGPIGFEYDPVTNLLSGRETESLLRALHRIMQHVYLRDAIRESDQTVQEVSVGNGAAPWPEILALLTEMEYTGWLTAIHQPGPNQVAELQRAIATVRRLLLGG